MVINTLIIYFFLISGTHYHYNMTREMSCDNILPWFALTNNGYLVGVGFQLIGKVTQPPKGRDWFEVYSGREVTEVKLF